MILMVWESFEVLELGVGSCGWVEFKGRGRLVRIFNGTEVVFAEVLELFFE
jgi:hypothetical protein